MRLLPQMFGVKAQVGHPFVRKRSIAVTDVGIQHPTHLLPHDPDPERVQCIMCAMPRSETVREPQEVLFVNLTEDRSHRMLSGRAMARSGLRMMPPFPSPSLKVGSRSGAVPRRLSIPGAPRFLWDWTH